MLDPVTTPELYFLAGGGEAGAVMRSMDWSASPLGQPRNWPPSLRTIVSLLLNSKLPMFLAWGPELGFLYNDGYAEILGVKHPLAMGCRFEAIWPEIWHSIEPYVSKALAGEATFHEDLPLIMRRKGFDEQVYFTFSYSPVSDETGGIGGMFCACTETTKEVEARAALRPTRSTCTAFSPKLPGSWRWSPDPSTSSGWRTPPISNSSATAFPSPSFRRLPCATARSLSAALDIAALGTFDWNLRDNTVTASERTRVIFGFGEGEGAKAEDYFSRMAPDDRDRVASEVEATLRGSGRLDPEYRIRLPDGSIRHVASLSQLYRDDQGQLEREVGCSKM